LKPYEPLLTWLGREPTATETIDRVQEGRLAWLARELAIALSGQADLADLWRSLSLRAVERILGAPIICQYLRVGGDAAELQRILRAEFALDQEVERRVDHWSALGDVWLGGAPPPEAAGLERGPDGRYHAPALACGISIDLSLPAVIAYPSANVAVPGLPDAKQIADSVARLDSAILCVAEVDPVMHHALPSLISNIVLRTNSATPERLQSGSSAAALGRVVLVNAGARANSTDMLAEVLIHEASHTAISTVELTCPLVTDAVPLADCRILSPWTGACLPVHAFLHACLVWYAVSGFWARVGRLDKRVERDARREMIRQGFLKLQPQAVLGPYRPHLHADGILLLQTIREKALVA